ncbi:hypothetical protein Amme_054_028 [Acidomonas methanolica NBRC 104435]|uniref:Uncharacterized protein n=1 Tax=Acidomonas methanolica NBRC 104435 TaxID=1231351 RepID=A0A023D612_ACIMT|nr:hypothetical protein Amme_054_028 [Acidomonas methanolica NBRC 104435]GEK99582.1 hypothetical protein AME01nite_20810 [Acidomonas methanolica NBRC 104435]
MQTRKRQPDTAPGGIGKRNRHGQRGPPQGGKAAKEQKENESGQDMPLMPVRLAATRRVPAPDPLMLRS